MIRELSVKQWFVKGAFDPGGSHLVILDCLHDSWVSRYLVDAAVYLPVRRVLNPIALDLINAIESRFG